MKTIFIWLLAFSTHATGRELLTNPALFMRCYAHLTQSRVPLNDPLLQQVVAGTKTPVDACMEVFDKARLGPSGTMDVTNKVGKKVFLTLHRVHASWFEQREFTPVGIDQPTVTGDIFDSETPAFYYTRAMFQPGVPFKYIVQGEKHLRAVRSDNDPAAGAISTRAKSTFVFDENLRLAPIGEFLGIQETEGMATNYSYTIGTTPYSGTVQLGAHFGGGILGSQPYLLLNINEEKTFRSDGGESMPRKWARGVFSDLMCRNLPVVRYGDVASFRVPTSPVSFRKTQGCVQCHASMDRMAASIRGFRYKNVGNLSYDLSGGGFANFVVPTGGSGTEWPSIPQTNYAQKDPDGVLFFRNYKGVLRDLAFRGTAHLGNLLAAEEDLFVCAAKRYYSYFLGVEVFVGDPPMAPALTEEEAVQTAHVEELGRALKADSGQSLRTLIRSIFELPEYQQSNFRP